MAKFALVFFVRHTYAGEREDFKKTNPGQSDDLRPLTKKGEKDAKFIGKGLKKLTLAKPRIFTSPYLRTYQTAKGIQNKMSGKVRVLAAEELKPNVDIKKWAAWFHRLSLKHTNIIVGHEPALSKYLGYLLTGKPQISFDIKKGTVIVLSLEKHQSSLKVQLKCYLPISDLKNLLKK
jgi:phosphohistidine phosphatase